MGGTSRVDGEAEPVDGDMVVIPAQGCQVVGLVVAAVLSFPDVVGLEPVTARASLDRTLPLIPPEDEGSDCGGDGFSQIGVGDRMQSVSGDQTDFARAEDLRQHVGSDARSGSDRGSGFPVGVGGEAGVDEHFAHRHRPPRSSNL